MSKIPPPPLQDSILDEDGNMSTSWALFFERIYQGDRGSDWSPNFVNLTQSGVPTITGRYYRLSDRMTYFSIRVVPGTNTSATAGTTYVDNFPLKFIQNGACHAVSGLLGSQAGMIDANTNRIYVPTWNSVTVPLVVCGMAEVR